MFLGPFSCVVAELALTLSVVNCVSWSFLIYECVVDELALTLSVVNCVSQSFLMCCR